MRKFSLLLILVLCFGLSACGGSTDNSTDVKTPNVSDNPVVEEAPPVEESEPQEEVSIEPMYFKSDEVVDKFFTDYNAVAEVVIPAEEIEKGNIRTKALVYIDDLSLEIINVNDYLSVSMSSSIENEDTKLYAVFRDTVKSMRPDASNEDIQAAWDSIHESGYMVEGYDFNGIVLDYVPSKELSYGMSDLRIDMEIPLN